MSGELEYPDQITELVDECRQRYPDSNWIRIAEYKRRITSEQWILVDVRQEAEIAVSSIPGAITIDEYCANLDAYEHLPALLYCTIGCRSGEVAESLLSEGYHVYNLWGGVVAWAFHGLSFSTSDQEETLKVHVFDEKWNVIPAPYETTW